MLPGFSGELDLFLGIPGDEIADAVDTSGGVRGVFRFHLNQNLSVHGAARFMVVNVKDLQENVDVTYFDIGAGGRFTLPVNPMLSLFGEVELLMSQVKVTAGPFSDTDRNPGAAARVGGLYKIAVNLDLTAFAGFTKNFAGDGPDEVDSRWVDIGAGAVLYF